jgi:hypothetical protein
MREVVRRKDKERQRTEESLYSHTDFDPDRHAIRSDDDI